MKVSVYSSDNPVLRLALEEIKRKLEESKILRDFDFMIIALNYRYPYENLYKNLQKIFDISPEDYFAFHATESFANIHSTEGILRNTRRIVCSENLWIFSRRTRIT